MEKFGILRKCRGQSEMDIWENVTDRVKFEILEKMAGSLSEIGICHK